MVLSTSAVEADVIAQLKTIVPRVYTTSVPEGISPDYPLIVVYFLEPVRTSADRNVVSTRFDTLRGGCTVEIQAPTDDAANKVKDKVRNLAGYRPPDCGEMQLEGGTAIYPHTSNGLNPTLYFRYVAFSWLTNLSTE